MTNRSIDERLSELARRTEALAPTPGFRARVLAAVHARSAATLQNDVVRSARWFVPAALLLAALSVGWATGGDTVSSVDVAATEQRWELEW